MNIFSKISIASLGLACTLSNAQEIATCRVPSGFVYYHFAGMVSKDQAGWSEDKVSKGVFSLTKLPNGAADILYVDIQNRPISSTQDGGTVRILRKSDDSVTVLVHYASATTEIYSFFKEKNGKHRFTWMQSKTGGEATFPKSSLMIGDCDPIRFGLL